MSAPMLHISAAGMCCALGCSTGAVTAAIRAGMDHFRESGFMGPDRRPLRCASIYNVAAQGPARLAVMFESVLTECLAQQPDMLPAKTCLILLVPETHRPGCKPSWPQKIYNMCTTGVSFHESSQICPLGRGGIGNSLLYARTVLEQKIVRYVLLAGVDSYLRAESIEYYLHHQRLFTENISDGFIPGEGAGAVVLELSNMVSGIHIANIEIADEFIYMKKNIPYKYADILTQTIRNSLDKSNLSLHETDFHISDCNGNTYYIKESTIAIQRNASQPMAEYPYLLVSPYIGETGAAAGPLILAYLTYLLSQKDSSGMRALVHFSSDDGKRCALIAEYNSQTQDRKQTS